MLKSNFKLRDAVAQLEEHFEVLFNEHQMMSHKVKWVTNESTIALFQASANVMFRPATVDQVSVYSTPDEDYVGRFEHRNIEFLLFIDRSTRNAVKAIWKQTV
jgi:hypothetical protein